MNNSGTRFAIFAMLWTVGVALMLSGIHWLLFFGLALIALPSVFFTQEHQVGRYRYEVFLVPAAGAVVFLLLALIDGNAFVQQTRPQWFLFLMLVIWFGAIVSGFYRWQRNRSRAGHG